MRSIALVALASVFVAVASGPARADASVQLEGCDDAEARELRTALVVELADADPSVTEILSTPGRATVRCADGLASARVQSGERFLGEDVPRATPGFGRRIAITLAELARAAATITAAPAEGPRRIGLATMGAFRVGGSPTLSLGGAAIGLSVEPAPWLSLVLDAEAVFGALSVALGTIDVRLGALAISARFGGELGPVALRAGPSVRGGFVSWSGSPASPEVTIGRDLWGAWVAAGATGEARILLAGALALRLEVEGDAVLLGSEAQGAGEAVAHLAGGLFAARAGVEARF